MYKAMVIKILKVRQQNTLIPEKRKINEVSSTVVPDYYLEKVSRLCCKEKEFRQNLGVSLHWGSRAGNLRRPKRVQFTGQGTRGKRARGVGGRERERERRHTSSRDLRRYVPLAQYSAE